MRQPTLIDTVRFWSRYQPEAVAVSDDRREVTWRGLDVSSAQLADGLAGHGVGPGDVVGILLGNCVEYIELAVAVLRAGAVVAPLNPRLTADELRLTAQDAGLRLVCADRGAEPVASAFAGVCPVVLCEPGSGAPHRGVLTGAGGVRGGAARGQRPGADDVAFLSYTSGSDGLPKGVMLSHRNVRTAALQRIPLEGLSTESRILLPSAMAYTGGLIVSFAELAVHSGGRLVITSTFDAEQVGRVIESRRITHLNIASPVLERLLDSLTEQDWSPASLRSVCIGGAAVSDRALETCVERGVPVAPSYGQSECAGGATFLRFQDLQRKFGSCGQPHMWTRVRLRRPDGELCAQGEVGEIEVRSDAVMLGYWGRPEDTAEVLRDGWLLTGDLATRDAEGFLTLAGRKKQLIISGGLNVYPEEIERVYRSLPGVEDVAVLGVPDERWGQVPLLVVCVRSAAGVTVEALRRCGVERLADYKRPKYAVVRDAPLPRTASGKLARKEIADRYRTVPGDALTLK